MADFGRVAVPWSGDSIDTFNRSPDRIYFSAPFFSYRVLTRFSSISVLGGNLLFPACAILFSLP